MTYRAATLVAPIAPAVLTRHQRIARWFVEFCGTQDNRDWRRWAGGRWACVCAWSDTTLSGLLGGCYRMQWLPFVECPCVALRLPCRCEVHS